MDQIQSQKGSSKVVSVQNMNNKRRLTEDQVRILDRNFNYEKKLEQEQKHRLAARLGIPARQVAVWYQNKRARWRTQALEVDCAALHRKLDTAQAEKRRLEREVLALRGELHMARQALQSTNNHNTNYYYDNNNTNYCYENNNNNAVVVSSYCTTTDQEQEGDGDGRSCSSFSDNPQYHLDLEEEDDDDDCQKQLYKSPTIRTTNNNDQEEEGDGRSCSSFSDNPQYDHLLGHGDDDDPVLEIDHDFFSSFIDW